MNKIAIHSVPRSGSSWLGEIINSSDQVDYSYQPLFSYAFKSGLSENSSLEQIDEFYRKIYLSEDDFITQKKARKEGIKPTFKKKFITHVTYKEVRYHYILENLLEKDSQQKVIGLIRNPLSVLNSWRDAPREFRADLGWDFNTEWKYAELKNQSNKEEYFGYVKWKEVALLYKQLVKKYPDSFLLVNYDDLISNPKKEVKNIFNFLGLVFGNQTEEFLRLSSNNHVSDTYSVYKKKKNIDDSWTRNLPFLISDEIIKDCHKNGLSEFLCL